MKGDYSKYIANFAEGDLKIQTRDSASKAYNEAIKRSEKLPILNPIRLGSLINYSFFNIILWKIIRKQ